MSEEEFQFDLQGLIKLLAKNLYAESDVFVREMLQNGHDSIKRKAEIQGNNFSSGNIRIRIDRDASTISFIDNGAGMTKQEIQEYLSTIGRSGTDVFRQELIKKGRSANFSLIGQFGIGLLSAFIVADRIVIETRSFKTKNPAWLWESYGNKTYNLEAGERKEPGTTATLYITENYRDMLDRKNLADAIRKYADFMPIPIYLNDDGEPTNTINAPWQQDNQNPREEIENLENLLWRRFHDTPLSIIPIHIKSPYRVDGVLYLSRYGTLDAYTTGLVDIYQSRMFVTRANRDILPVWARFVRGIIDSPDLTLTASRDAIKQDNIYQDIRESLGKAIIEHLTKLSQNDLSRFQSICQWHHYDFKGMAIQNDTFFQEIDDLVPFQTNQGIMNLPNYFKEAKRRKQSPKEILYFDEFGSATQFNLLCEARKLLVVNASNPFDKEFLKLYSQFHIDIDLRQIDIEGSELIFEPLSQEEEEEYRDIKTNIKQDLPDYRSVVKVVKFKPESIPALTVLSEAAKAQRELQEKANNPTLPDSFQALIKGVMDSERTLPITLYVNVSNPTIQQLAKMPLNNDSQRAWTAIYNNAVMLAQRRLLPQNIEEMFESFNYVINRMITQTNEVQKLDQKINQLKLEIQDNKRNLTEKLAETQKTEHISCFFAMPFDEEYEPLLKAVRQVLEDKPYGWQVIRADEQHHGTTIATNIM
ncbi:MAG: ATP-binding protein, partial [Xenococcus sp. (in: cyanobacteria)]